MNKTFKRAVSSVLASAMAFSSVTVATVSTTLPFTATQAFAAETTTVASWKSGDATIPAAFGAEAALSSIGNSQTIKTSATTTFSDNFVTVAGTTANDAYSCVSAVATDNTGAAKGAKYCVFIPTATGNLNLYVINSGSKATKANSIRVYNNLTNNNNGTYALPTAYDQYDVHGYLEGAAVAPVSIPVTKGTPVCVYFGNSKSILLGMTLVGTTGGDDTTTTTEATTATAPAAEEGGIHKEIKVKFIEGTASFMSLVAIALVIGLAFCIERIIYLSLAEINTKKFMASIEAALEKGDVEAAKDIARNTRGPVASIYYQGLMRIDQGIDVVEKSVVSYGGVQAGYLEKGCSWITLFIAMAPSLGFLGTVIGMVQAFDKIQQVGDISPTVVAGGMKVALITTIFGLIVALILQVFYNYVLSKIEALTSEMEDSSISLLDMVIKYNLKYKK